MEVLVHRLTVRSRIIASFGVLLAILVGSNALALQRLGALEDAERRTTEQVVPYVNDLQTAALLAKSIANDERGFLLSGDAKFAAEVEERQAKVHQALDRATKIDGGKNAGDVGQIRASFDAWTDALRAEFALFGSDRDAARAKALGVNRDLRKTYEAQFATALERAISEQKTSNDAAKRAAENGRRLVLLLLVLAALVAVVVGAWLLRSVQKPIDEAVDVLSRAADGDLAGRLQARSNDEFGMVADSVNRLLQQTATVVGAMTGTATRLRESSEELRVTSNGLGVAADGTASVADSAAASAQQVSASVDTVAAATEEMGASIREIARSAEEASSVAREAVIAASDADATVARLGQSSSEINDVVALITSIAGQTNLLALNATIEAARAGDAGKGFAVVAGEVKELATETARATDDISSRITAIRSDADDAVTAIRRIAQVIDRIDALQTTIASAVEEQSVTTASIAATISDAAGGTGQIAETVSAVADGAKTTTNAAARTASAADTLSRLSVELSDAVGRFRVS